MGKLTLGDAREFMALMELCEDGTGLTAEESKRYWELSPMWEAEQDRIRDYNEDRREDFEDED
jgi:hypothetical protein